MLTLTLTNTNPNPHRGLGRSLGETKAEVRGLRAEVVQQRMQMQQLLEMQRQLLASQLGAVATAPAGLSSSLSPGCPVPDGPAAPSTPSAAPSAAPLPASPLAAAVATASWSPLQADSAALAASPTGASPAAASGVSPLGMGPLMPHVATGSEPRPSLIEMSEPLGDVYANIMARGGAVPSTLGAADKGRCKLLLQWCNATATADEKLLLSPAKVHVK